MSKKKKQKKRINKDIYERRGRDCFSKGDYRQAIAEWKPLLREKSVDGQIVADLAKAYYRYGRSLCKENNLEAAGANLSNAVRLQPNNSLYAFHLGCCLHKAGQLKEAMSAYRQALRLEPDNEKIKCCLALACLRSGQTKEAIGILQRSASVEKIPYLIVAYLKENKIDDCCNLLESLRRDERAFFGGILFLVKNEADKALPLLKKASQVANLRKIAAYYLAVAYIRQDQLQKASQALKTAYQSGLRHSRADKNLKILSQKLGLRFIKEGKIDEAKDVWERLLEIEPQNEEVRHNLGHAYYLLGNTAVKEGNINQAIDYWLKAEMIDDTNPDILHNLALGFDRLEEHQRASKYWARVIQIWRKAFRSSQDERLKGYLSVAYRHLGENYLSEDEVQKAIAAYNSALAYDPEDIEIRLELGELYLYEERIDSAIKEFKEILKHNPNHIEALNNLGMSYDLDEQPGQAIKYWEKAIELEPANPLIKTHLTKAYGYQSSLLTKQGKFEEALRLIDKMEELSGESEDSQVIRGFIYMDMNDLSRAEEHYQRAIRFESRAPRMYVEIGYRYLDCDLVDKAEEYFEQAIELSEEDPFIPYAIGMSYCMKKRCQEAHHYFDLAIEKSPKLLEMPHRIGEILFEEMNCREGAKKYLKRAVEMIPDNPEIHFKLGTVYMHDFDREQAWEEFEIAEELARDVGDREIIDYIHRIRNHYQGMMAQKRAMQSPGWFL